MAYSDLGIRDFYHGLKKEGLEGFGYICMGAIILTVTAVFLAYSLHSNPFAHASIMDPIATRVGIDVVGGIFGLAGLGYGVYKIKQAYDSYVLYKRMPVNSDSQE